MNLILREIKSNIKSIIFWSLGISLLIFGVISKMSVIQDQGVNIDELMAGFPKILMVLFGFSSVPLDNPEGIFVITMTYIVIGLLIHASILGARTMTKEEEDNTAEFLFLKPISRTSIFIKKVIANIISIVLIDSILIGVSIISIITLTSSSDINFIFIYFIYIFILQLFVLSIGNIIGNSTTNRGVTISALIGLAFYFIHVLVLMVDNMEYLNYLSPLTMLSGENIYNGDINNIYVIGLLILSIIIFIISCKLINKKDIKMI